MTTNQPSAATGSPQRDPSSDYLRKDRPPLNVIFRPRSVAVIGATEKEGSVGRTILRNLVDTPFGGAVYPVNLKRNSVLGIRAYPNIAEVPERVDLAVIVTPAFTVPEVIGECVEAGVKGAIIISAGFRETGEQGADLERQVQERIAGSRMRVIGPNCLGVMNPLYGLNATFAAGMALPGSVGFISQSGALCTAILDWSYREQVGFSAFVSSGAMLDVGWGDLIYYLGDDPRTRCIVIYMESVGDARSFMSAAREVSYTKPIIVIKAGRSAEAAQAAASHTGALTGSDEVLHAAFRRCGVLRVNSIAELFYMAEILGKQPRPKGPRLTILTNAGGPGVLATDALIEEGGELAQLTDETVDKFNQFLPAHWSHANPIDILGDAGPNRYAQALEVASQDEGSDGMLVILTPQAMTDPTGTAEKLKPLATATGKPILASFMGGVEVATGESILSQAGIPTFPYPDTAARMFMRMWQYSHNLAALYETPALPHGSLDHTQALGKVEQLLEEVRSSGRQLLSELESKRLLSHYGIPIVATHHAATEDDAVRIAGEIGYPVVLKLHSETITHKTDVGGVQLDLQDEQEVRAAFAAIRAAVKPDDFGGVTVQPMMDLEGYELIIGSSIDPQFGPVLLFGSGGQLVEVYRDRALGLPPLTTTLARRMMERTSIYKALQGVRGRQAVDLDALEKLLVQFSYLVSEHRWIKEIDINPLLASPDGIVALDARVVLWPPDTQPEDLPRTAVRPYPTQHVQEWTSRDGTPLIIRPIRPEDEPLLVQFHESLSSESVYFRYFHAISLGQRIAHERLCRICFVDYDREMALVAERRDPESDQPEIIGVGRLSRAHDAPEAEFAIVISDRWQRRGLGTELLRRLVDIGRQEGLRRITASILGDNKGMRMVAEKLGFALTWDAAEGVYHAALELS